MSEQSTVVLILGMHRSGTSALTRVLNLCGVELGGRLLPPADGNNQHGFWEHADAVDIDERILHHLGRSWWDARSLPARWLESPVADASRGRIAALARGEFSAVPLWGIKDPRICRLLPLWIEALRDAGATVKLVFMLRHPEEVIASLAQRDGLSTAESGLLLLNHFFEAAANSTDLTRCVVTYQMLMDDWRGCVERIARELSIELPSIAGASSDIDAFLKLGARHHHVAEDAVALSQSLNGRVYQLAREARSSAEFWLGAAPLFDAWDLYRRDLIPYVDELLSMLAVRGSVERREFRTSASVSDPDTASLSPLAHLQFRMITGLQDGVGRLGQAAADIAAMVRVGTEAAVGVSEKVAGRVAALNDSVATLQRDVAGATESSDRERVNERARAEAELATLRGEVAGAAARQEHELAELRRRGAEAESASQQRHGALVQQMAAMAEQLDGMARREQARDDARLMRRLRRLLTGK